MICIDKITTDYSFVENVAKEIVLQHHPYATFEADMVGYTTRSENVYILLARILKINEGEARYLFDVEQWNTTHKAAYLADAKEGFKKVVSSVCPKLEPLLFP